MKPLALFANSFCARTLRRLASVGSMSQRELMQYAHSLGMKAQFTYGFARFLYGPDAPITKVRCQGTLRVIPMLHWTAPIPRAWIRNVEDLNEAWSRLEYALTAPAVEPVDAEETVAWLKMVEDERQRRKRPRHSWPWERAS